MTATAVAAPAGPTGGCQHPPGAPGHLDETARRLSHEEYAVADRLAHEGHAVRSVASGRERTPDLEVCGRGVEVKSWLPLAERGGRRATARSVFNKLMDASEQASVCVLYGRGSGLTSASARSGVSLFAARAPSTGVTDVRVIGDGFDLSWTLSAGRARAMRSPSVSLG